MVHICLSGAGAQSLSLRVLGLRGVGLEGNHGSPQAAFKVYCESYPKAKNYLKSSHGY